MPRTKRMLSDEELAELLSVDRLALPSRPKVVDIKFEEYQDSTGDDALEIHVILDDATPDSQRRWARIGPIEEAIRQALQNAGEARFPYITAATLAEYERRYSYDPSEDE